MKHQPFETWILLDESLSPEDVQLLDAHLKGCEECRMLKAAWGHVDMLFQETPALEPVAGFADRWQMHLNRERSLQRNSRYRWQSWITLILIANAVSLLAVLLGLQFLNNFHSLTEILLLLVYRLTAMITFINVFQNLLAVVIRTLPGLLSPAGWAGVAAMVSAGTLLWVFSISHLAGISWRAQKQ